MTNRIKRMSVLKYKCFKVKLPDYFINTYFQYSASLKVIIYILGIPYYTYYQEFSYEHFQVCDNNLTFFFF